jgi:hypothetical protein
MVVPDHSVVCIYCRSSLPPLVPPEHVIPQSFGKFDNNFTLHCVCSECNGFFGRTIEWALRGNSVEGALRLQLGLGTGTLGTHKGSVRFTLSDATPMWNGANVKIIAKGRSGRVEAIPLPQVGARRTPEEHWKWYAPAEITPDFALQYPKGSKSEFHVVSSNKREQDRIVELLKKNGVDFHPKDASTPPIDSAGTIGTLITADFDQQISRCIAKIAFNYLAYCCGAPFVLVSDFDDVRAYIREGRKPVVTVVRHHRKRLLIEEAFGGRATEGHIILIDWTPDARSIVAQVSLFNSFRYIVVLCNSFHGLWTPALTQGHHFDVKRRRIEPLGMTRLRIPYG